MAVHLDSFTELLVLSLLKLVHKQDRLAHWIKQRVLKTVKPKTEFQRIKQVPESGDFGPSRTCGIGRCWASLLGKDKACHGGQDPLVAGRSTIGVLMVGDGLVGSSTAVNSETRRG